MRNRFVLTAGDGGDQSVILVGRVLPLFRLHSQSDSGGTG